MNLVDSLVTAVFKPARQLGPYSAPPSGVAPLTPFAAQVTIKELHTDNMVITEHPVEQGASITDHAYKQPAELMLVLGWSNSSLQGAAQTVIGLASILSGDQGGDFNYMKTMYDKLLSLQLSRIPIDVTTGKRKYTNMLIRSLTVPTEDKSEHALFVTMILKEVIIVTTQAVISTPAAVQKNPKSTAAPVQVGSKQLVPTTLKAIPGVATGDYQIGGP